MPSNEVTSSILKEKNKNGYLVDDIQNQLILLMRKLEGEVSPEFKALMEGYVNKANEAEELKVKLENISSTQEGMVEEIEKIRETNRNLIHELNSGRDVIRDLEFQLSNLQVAVKKSEEEYKEKIDSLKEENKEYKEKTKKSDEEKAIIKEENERMKMEVSSQNFEFRQKEREMAGEIESLNKQLDEQEVIILEQREQVDFKTKEIEYKEALLNQLIKQTTNEKFNFKPVVTEDNLMEDLKPKKRKFGVFG